MKKTITVKFAVVFAEKGIDPDSNPVERVTLKAKSDAELGEFDAENNFAVSYPDAMLNLTISNPAMFDLLTIDTTCSITIEV